MKSQCDTTVYELTFDKQKIKNFFDLNLNQITDLYQRFGYLWKRDHLRQTSKNSFDTFDRLASLHSSVRP